MSSFPKAAKPQWAGKENGDKPSSTGPSTNGTQKAPVPKASLRHIVMALKEHEKNAIAPKATSTEPGRPLNAHRLMHDATTGHMSEKPSRARRLSHDATGHMDGKSHGHHVDHPHHAHTMLDDHLKTPIDHSIHWTQLLVSKKPHKKDVMEKALATMMHLKNNDDILEKLKDDSSTKLETAVLMSRVAGNLATVIQEEPAESKSQGQTKKTPLRSAKSLKRDAALDRLTKVMNECQQPRSQHAVEMMKEKEETELVLPVVGKNDEEEHRKEQVETKENWKILNFEESPKRKREKLDAYSVITQRRKASRPNTPGLDLIGVFEVVPHTPPRARSVEQYAHTEKITVHAADFIKYGDDVEMLKTLQVTSAPMSEPVAVEDLQKSTGDDKQSTSRRGSGAGIADLQIPQSHIRGQSASGSPPGSRPTSQPPSRPASRPRSGPFSARTSRPGVARLHADTYSTWPASQPPSRPASRPSSTRTSRPGTARKLLLISSSENAER